MWNLCTHAPTAVCQDLLDGSLLLGSLPRSTSEDGARRTGLLLGAHIDGVRYTLGRYTGAQRLFLLIKL